MNPSTHQVGAVRSEPLEDRPRRGVDRVFASVEDLRAAGFTEELSPAELEEVRQMNRYQRRAWLRARRR